MAPGILKNCSRHKPINLVVLAKYYTLSHRGSVCTNPELVHILCHCSNYLFLLPFL
jgi:hypothetical protein